MMNRDKEWLDAVRGALRDTEVAPPEGVWRRLERDLDAALPHNAHRLRRRVWLRAVGAAAAVLLAIVAGEYWWRSEHGMAGLFDPAADGAALTHSGSTAEKPEAESAPLLAETVPAERQKEPVSARGAAVRTGETSCAGARGGSDADRTAEKSTRAAASQTLSLGDSSPRAFISGYMTASGAVDASGAVLSSGAGSTDPAVQADAAARENAVRTGADAPIVPSDGAASALPAASSADAARTDHSAGAVRTQTAEQTSKAAQERPSDTRTADWGRQERRTYHAETGARYHGKTSFGLYAGGVVSGSGNDASGSRSLPYGAPSLLPGNAAGEALRMDYRDFSYRHRQPLSFGVSVRKEFRYGLSLESGVTYTLLRSDASLYAGSDDIAQRLHFIGVPLRLNWRFLEAGRFSIYIGAGGMVEKCVSASFGSSSVAERSVQWSALGAAGGQYRLGSVVALYFEPEISYYFTQTVLRTARTDSPLTFTLRLGVRFSF